MASLYHSLFTEKGLELLRTAIQTGTKLGITHMSFGDGNGILPTPDAKFTQMIKEVYRVQLNRLAPSKENPNWLEADGVIPSAIGGFNIREVGLWAGDVMVAYANYPPTYKPSGDQGTAQIKTIRIVLQIDNTANFELKIDASVVMATIQSVEEAKIEAKTYADTTKIHTVKSFYDFLTLEAWEGRTVRTKGYHRATNFALAQPFAGGGTYVYNSEISKSNHNGGTFIDETKVFPSDWTNRPSVLDWFNASSTGKGCWVLVYSGQVDVTHFGANPYFSIGVDNSIAINKALSVKNNIHLPAGNYIVHRPILTSTAHPVITGDGITNTLITVEDNLWQPITFSKNNKEYNAVVVVTSGVDMAWIEGAVINNLSIWGNSYSADGKIGLFFDNVCLKVNVENVEVTTCDTGIYTLKSWVHSYKNLTVTDCITYSMHLDTYVNGYSLSGVCLYGKSIITLCHLKIEGDSYGSTFTGGAIEKCHVGVSVHDRAQINITGVDWEAIDTLHMEVVNCPDLPSKVSTCAVMGNPTQSCFATRNGSLIVEASKIFNPYGNINAPIYFAEGSGGIVINNNEYGEHTTFIGGTGKVTGTDVGRYDFTKSKRITDAKILDAYNEFYQNYFDLFTNTLESYKAVSGKIIKTQIGNTHSVQINTLLEKMIVTTGDYITFTIPELAGHSGHVGSFIFSKSNSILSTDCINGSVICDNGTCYLTKNVGGLFTKAELNQTTNTNLFSISLQFQDTI